MDHKKVIKMIVAGAIAGTAGGSLVDKALAQKTTVESRTGETASARRNQQVSLKLADGRNFIFERSRDGVNHLIDGKPATNGRYELANGGTIIVSDSKAVDFGQEGDWFGLHIQVGSLEGLEEPGTPARVLRTNAGRALLRNPQALPAGVESRLQSIYEDAPG